MRRIDTNTADPDLHGAGKSGFTDGNPATGIPSTRLSANWFNGVQEEIAQTVESAGLVLDPNDNTQLSQAIQTHVANSAFSGAWGDITGKPDFSEVATSGAYADLTGAPDISGYVAKSEIVYNAQSQPGTGGPNGTIIGLANERLASFGEQQPHEAYSDFNQTPDTWGHTFVLGTTNGPPHGGTQGGFRSRFAIGSQYGGNALEMLVPRQGFGADASILWSRQMNEGVWGEWHQMGGIDQHARDQLALTNMRLMLASSVSTGALVAGQQWDLSSSALTGFVTAGMQHSGDAVPIPYLENIVTTTTGPAGWTPASGTSFSPTTALNDGTTSYASASGSTVYIGIASGGASLTGYDLTCPNSTGFNNSSGLATVSVIGSATANPSAGTVLHTATYPEAVSAEPSERIWSANFAPLPDFNFYYLRLSFGSTVTWYVSGVTWRTLTFTDGTVISPTVSAAEVPSTAAIYFLWSPYSDGVLSDLSVLLSRDNGTTWVSALHTPIASYDSAWQTIKAEVALDGTIADSSLKFRINVSSARRHRIAAPALYVG